MKKLNLIFVLCFSTMLIVGCSNQPTTSKADSKLKQRIETLVSENKQLKVQNQETLTELSDNPSNEQGNQEINQLVKQFINAQYDYTNPAKRLEAIKPYVTSELMNVFDNPAIRTDGESTIETISKVDNCSIYQVRVSENGATAILEVDTSFQVDKNTPVKSSYLIKLNLIKYTNSTYSVNKECIYLIKKNSNL